MAKENSYYGGEDIWDRSDRKQRERVQESLRRAGQELDVKGAMSIAESRAKEKKEAERMAAEKKEAARARAMNASLAMNALRAARKATSEVRAANVAKGREVLAEMRKKKQ